MSEFEDFKNELNEAIKSGKIYHGKATLKKPLEMKDYTIPENTNANITAFLPEMDVYAVMFDEIEFPGAWITFTDLEVFNEYFIFQLYSTNEIN